MELIVPVAGGEIWAEDTGGDGTPLVLVHPGWGNADIWSQLIGLLPGHRRVIRYDDRGHGRSPAPSAPYTKAADLHAVLDHAGLTSAVIVGHSGGGGTALGLALSDPGHVTSLVLIAPGVPDYPWPEDDPYAAEFTRLFAAGDSDGLVDLGLATWAPVGDDGAARSQITSAVSTFLAGSDLEMPSPAVYGRLGEVRAPTVMVRGDREYPMVAECSDTIAARIPDSRRIVVPGADHLLPLRVPGRLAEIINEQAGLPDTAGR
jgi:3-oxoadipate enol-lactonase